MNRMIKVLAFFAAVLTLWGVPAAAQVDEPAVLVTGANRGIGFEFVKQYTDKGWFVIATCRNPDSAEELNAWAAEHDNVVVEKLDLVDHEGIDALAEKYEDQPLEVLLNNAGLMRGPDVEQMVGSIDYDEFDRFYRTNAMGPLKVTEAFSPHILAGEQRVMAVLTTGKGERGIPVPGFTLYKTSKAALDSIQKEVAIRWKGRNVKAITLMPGRVLTHGEDPTTAGENIVAVEDSVSGMIDIIDNASMDQNGRTINWDGEIIE